jgi:hypothetical protein
MVSAVWAPVLLGSRVESRRMVMTWDFMMRNLRVRIWLERSHSLIMNAIEVAERNTGAGTPSGLSSRFGSLRAALGLSLSQGEGRDIFGSYGTVIPPSILEEEEKPGPCLQGLAGLKVSTG